MQQLFRVPVLLLKSYYEVSLTNSNPLLHPARLYTLWSHWHEGIVYPEESLFYEQWTDEASALLIQMDEEFQQLLCALPVTKGSIPTILDYYESTDAPSLTRKLRSIQAFKGIKAPMKQVAGGYVPDFGSGPAPSGGSYDTRKFVSGGDNYGALFEEKTVQASKSMIVAGGKYVLTPVASGVLLVHVRRALTRILYEKMLHALQAESPVGRISLFPVEVQVGAAHVPTFVEYASILESLGFDIVPFSTASVSVNAMPEGWDSDEMSVRDTVAELLQILEEEGAHSSLPQMMQSALAQKFARTGAARYQPLKSPAEAQQLLDELFATSNADLTPSGQRITSIVGAEEIEKRFS
jgi:hypothetical protein